MPGRCPLQSIAHLRVGRAGAVSRQVFTVLTHVSYNDSTKLQFPAKLQYCFYREAKRQILKQADAPQFYRLAQAPFAKVVTRALVACTPGPNASCSISDVYYRTIGSFGKERMDLIADKQH